MRHHVVEVGATRVLVVVVVVVVDAARSVPDASHATALAPARADHPTGHLAAWRVAARHTAARIPLTVPEEREVGPRSRMDDKDMDMGANAA